MESNDSISFFLMGPEDSIPRWRSAGQTPDCSPLDLHPDAFPDFDQGGIFHELEGSRMHSEVPHPSGPTAALNQQLRSIGLTNHSKSMVSHLITFSPPQRDEASDMTFELGHPTEWEGSQGGSSNASHQALASGVHDFVTPVDRTYRHVHEGFLQIETSLQEIDQQPLSGFSEQSTINSTPINSSCSENSRGRDSVWSPYPPPHYRRRSLSACGNLHVAGTRRRSSSDAYTMAGSSLFDGFTPSDPYPGYLDVPGLDKSGELPYTLYPGSDSSTDLQSSRQGCDRRNRPPPRGRYSQSLSPGYHHHQVQPHSAVDDTRNIRRGSLSGAGSPVKAQVAPVAVKRAAWKKRKNPDGKLFECDLCHDKLTTKQNLQYHTSAHLGIRDYPCKICEKRFTTPHVQKRHERRCPDMRSSSS